MTHTSCNLMSKIVKAAMAISLLLVALNANADDSIPAKELQEITVTADRGWIEGNKTVFIPTKSEKKLANSPATLINNMDFPQLQVVDGKILGPDGKEVTLFINGRKMQPIDISTFWPKLAKRVEYIRHPDEANFEGAEHAVNFIMTEYESGGVTRVNVMQDFPNINLGWYDVASKLEYKRMTYGAQFHGSYRRDHSQKSSGVESYRDLYYNNNHYDQIDRDYEEHSFARDNIMNASLSAAFNNSRWMVFHRATFIWFQNPGSGSTGNNLWTDNIFGSENSTSRTDGLSISPSITGGYTYQFNPRWYLHFFWQYSHSSNKSNSRSRIGECETIFNSSKERNDNLTFGFMPTFYAGDKITLQLYGEGKFKWFNTLYAGSFDNRIKQSRRELKAYLNLFWKVSKVVKIALRPQIYSGVYTTGEIRKTELTPGLSASVGVYPSDKVSLSGSVTYFSFTPPASSVSTALVQNSELLWVEGNPYLKSPKNWYFSVNASYLPFRWLSISGNVDYRIDADEEVSLYRIAPADLGGLVKSLENATMHHGYAYLALNSRILDGRLSINVRPEWWYHKAVACDANMNQAHELNHCVVYADVAYILRNCRFNVSYNTPQKELMRAGCETVRRDGSYSLGFSYGTGDFYLNVTLRNLFDKYSKRKKVYDSPYYYTSYRSYEIGRYVSINLTYTLGYGKKINRNIQSSSFDLPESSVLK